MLSGGASSTVHKFTLLFKISGDSWLGDDEVMGSGRGSPSPRKRVHGSIRPTASASTVDSYDAAFQRQPNSTLVTVQSNTAEQHEPRDDDFFG